MSGDGGSGVDPRASGPGPDSAPAVPGTTSTSEASPVALAAAVVTCSDSAASGAATDESGPLAVELLRDFGHRVVDPPTVVPDDATRIGAAVRAAIAAGARIVVTTGGTGAGPRDVTPEALRALGLRELPGLGEAMRAAARARIPATDLSRSLGGILDGAVILALPGSPGGVRDGLAAVGPLLGHAAGMAAGDRHPHSRRSQPQPPRHPTDPAPAQVFGSDPAESLLHGAPVGGSVGGGLVRAEPITEAEVAAAVTSRSAGAVVTFAGVVRDHDHDRAVTALTYESHPDASAVLAQVLAEALSRPGVLGAAALHRVGDLVVGDLAFTAAVSAAHRREAFEACGWLVDEAKARLPIWKHQRFADGTDEWVNCP